MSIFSRLRAMRSRDRPRSGQPVNAIPIYNAIMGLRSRQDLKGSEAIYSAVSRISNTIACMPLHLYRGYKRADGDPRERCVAYAPNGTVTPYTFKLAVESCRDTQGTAYILILRKPDFVTVDRLDPIDPVRVKILQDRETREYWYEITLDNGKTVVVHNSDMIVLHHMSTDGITGVSPLEVLGATLDYDRKVHEASITQLEGFGDSIVLNYASNLGQEKRDSILAKFLAAYKESRGHILLLDAGVTADKITGSLVDPKVLDVDNITKRKVAAVYNLPPRMLGDSTASGYSTSEQDIAEFMKLTILPIATQYEEAFNRKLLTYDEIKQGYTFRFDMDALKRGDTAAIADKHQKGVRSGTLTPNEARAENGLPPLPYGDELFMSRDLIPARISVEHPELLLGGQASSETEDQEQPPEKQPKK